ncbi:hypothetical protein HYX70_04410 [Candidatus Saccharibacteria bacterium]|nr:hypothetical protein [Candidatus Saccharibacteria bacterium]
MPARNKKKKLNRDPLPAQTLWLAVVLVAIAGLAMVFVSQAYRSVDTTKAGTVVSFTKGSNLNQQTSANNGTTRFNLALKSGLKYCWWGNSSAGAQTQGSVRYNDSQTVAFGANDFKLDSISQPLFCFTSQYDSNNAEVFISVSGKVNFSSMRVTQP